MLDEYQNAAAMHGSGPCLALAGPGSGKTTVLVHRICNLIGVYNVPPNEILVVTFTKDAAREMRQRFLALNNGSAPVTFGTFHGICYQILRQESAFCGMHIISASEKRVIFKRLMRDIPEAYDDDNYQDYLEQAFGLYRRAYNDQKFVERAGLTCGLSENELKEHFDRYTSEKNKLNAMDFDDLIGIVLDRFRNDGNMLARWRERFKYFLVDEMQDMDEKQFELIRLLSKGDDNVFAVGDDDQSIYAFRGAAPHIMLSFKDYYPDAKIIRLERNYRSASKICDAAHRLIVHNKIRYEKDPVPMSMINGNIRIVECMDEKEEADRVIRLLKTEKLPTAVIYRNRAASAELVRYLDHSEVNYHIAGKTVSDDRFGIEGDIVAYLSAAKGPVKREDLLRIINRPNRYLSRDYMDEDPVDMNKLLSYFEPDSDEYEKLSALIAQLGIIKDLRPYAALNFIRKGIGYDDYLKQEEEKRHLSDGTMIKEAERIGSSMREMADINEALSYFGRRSDSEASENGRGEVDAELMTFHASKGLEYDRVILIECNEGITPSNKAQTPEALEEERRLFYVALTRAKKEAVLFTTRKNSNKITYPSRFISEIA